MQSHQLRVTCEFDGEKLSRICLEIVLFREFRGSGQRESNLLAHSRYHSLRRRRQCINCFGRVFNDHLSALHRELNISALDGIRIGFGFLRGRFSVFAQIFRVSSGLPR